MLHGLLDDLRRLSDAADSPLVPGTGAAGVVVACGNHATRFRRGDRVSCESWFGGLAERMVAKESKTAFLPANVDFIVGSTILHTYLTAWYALIERAQLQAGETVLVTGAAGGVGLACVEVAHLLGARIIAVVGSAAKAAIVKYGAEEVVDYSREDVRQRVKAFTGDEGLDVCVENVGGTLFTTLARLMRWNGRLTPIGFTSGEVPSLAMNLPLLRNYSIVGVFTGAWTERFPDDPSRAARGAITAALTHATRRGSGLLLLGALSSSTSLELLARGPEQDFVHINLLRLAHGEGDCPRE